MPGYPSFPKPPENLGRIIVLTSTPMSRSNGSIPASASSVTVGLITIPFNCDIESGYVTVDHLKVRPSVAGGVCQVRLKEGTTKIGSVALTTACAGTTSYALSSAALSTVAAPAATAFSLASGYNQFAAGAVIKVQATTGNACAPRGIRVTLIGMKVDRTYGYRA